MCSELTQYNQPFLDLKYFNQSGYRTQTIHFRHKCNFQALKMFLTALQSISIGESGSATRHIVKKF